jgi:hypothetical protein
MLLLLLLFVLALKVSQVGGEETPLRLQEADAWLSESATTRC